MSANILYYKWNEYTYNDAYSRLVNLGYNVYTFEFNPKQYDNDDSFISYVKKLVQQDSISIVFSFNYYPDLSRVAIEMGIRYISWVFDSPHMTLESITLNNECNTVNIFDYALYEKYANKNITTVRYMPLACNVERIEKALANINTNAYQHDITFLGTLYNDEFNFYDQIKHMPNYVRGYIDAAMEAQKNLFGMNIIDEILTDEICTEIFKSVNIDMGPLYNDCKRNILINMILKKITVEERRNLLTVLGEYYNVDHYAGSKTAELPVNYKGYASYTNEMPEIFATSKINLNISLRSILTGIPLRVIDILGAGGFCISNYQAELAEYFENNKSIVWYESYEDLFTKVDYYLKHDAEREAIARAGHEIVKNQFSYDILLPKVLA